MRRGALICTSMRSGRHGGGACGNTVGSLSVVVCHPAGTFQAERPDEEIMYGILPPMKTFNPVWQNLATYDARVGVRACIASAMLNATMLHCMLWGQVLRLHQNGGRHARVAEQVQHVLAVSAAPPLCEARAGPARVGNGRWGAQGCPDPGSAARRRCRD